MVEKENFHGEMELKLTEEEKKVLKQLKEAVLITREKYRRIGRDFALGIVGSLEWLLGEKDYCDYTFERSWERAKNGELSRYTQSQRAVEDDDVEASFAEIKAGKAKKFKDVDMFLKELKE